MSMYTLTREEASEKLGVSIRSVDRYLKSGKLRSEKDWKVVMINEDDVNSILWWWTKKQTIITPEKAAENNNTTSQKNIPHNFETKEIATEADINQQNSKLESIYEDLREEIKEKDKKIWELTFKLWKMEEVVKNSISLIEFKKSQFLLEESKQATQKDLDSVKKEKEIIEEKYKDEKNVNNILIVVSVVLFILLAYIWYSKI